MTCYLGLSVPRLEHQPETAFYLVAGFGQGNVHSMAGTIQLDTTGLIVVVVVSVLLVALAFALGHWVHARTSQRWMESEVANNRERSESIKNDYAARLASEKAALAEQREQMEIAFRKQQDELQLSVQKYREQLLKDNDVWLVSHRAELQAQALESAKQSLKAWKDASVKDIRREAIEKSRAVLTGKFSESMAPFLPDFPWEAIEARFLGNPVDFIVFDGIEQDGPVTVVIVEIKSGDARLSKKQRRIREAIEEKRVEWHEIRVDDGIVDRASIQRAIEPALEELFAADDHRALEASNGSSDLIITSEDPSPPGDGLEDKLDLAVQAASNLHVAMTSWSPSPTLFLAIGSLVGQEYASADIQEVLGVVQEWFAPEAGLGWQTWLDFLEWTLQLLNAEQDPAVRIVPLNAERIAAIQRQLAAKGAIEQEIDDVDYSYLWDTDDEPMYGLPPDLCVREARVAYDAWASTMGTLMEMATNPIVSGEHGSEGCVASDNGPVIGGAERPPGEIELLARRAIAEAQSGLGGTGSVTDRAIKRARAIGKSKDLSEQERLILKILVLRLMKQENSGEPDA